MFVHAVWLVCGSPIYVSTMPYLYPQGHVCVCLCPSCPVCVEFYQILSLLDCVSRAIAIGARVRRPSYVVAMRPPSVKRILS